MPEPASPHRPLRRAPKGGDQGSEEGWQKRKRSRKETTPCTCTRCWSRSTPTRASRPRPWESWIRSWMIFPSASLARHRAWPITTSVQPSHQGRSRPPFAPAVARGAGQARAVSRVPRLSPSTPAQVDIFVVTKPKALFAEPPHVSPSELRMLWIRAVQSVFRITRIYSAFFLPMVPLTKDFSGLTERRRWNDLYLILGAS